MLTPPPRMAAPSAPTAASLSRSRPVYAVLVGAFVLYAGYLLYVNRPAPSSHLHRSNAIHRRRNPRSHAQSQLADAAAGAENTEDQDAPPPERPYGIFVVSDPNDPSRRHRIPLVAGRLPDVNWFRNICHTDRETAEILVQDAQRQFLNTYLWEEVGSTTMVSSSGLMSESIYRRLIGWGIPRHQSVAAFTRHNTRVAQAQRPEADGTRETIVLPAGNDDETDVASLRDIGPGSTGNGANENSSGHALRKTLYYIAEEQARNKGIVHRGITCDGCRTNPIRGIRWRCTNCIDYDLCSDCEATDIHPKTHMFQKVTVPARYLGYTRNPMPVYFPGNPGFMPNMVPNAIRRSLEQSTGYEPEEIDGLWEQFTCLANVQWEQDPNKLGARIDRRAFDKSFVPRYTAKVPAQNLVYDRVFSFFDTDQNGFIDFVEFVEGMNMIRTSTTSSVSKLRRIFDCYDIDRDGCVNRKDFLRIFRAYFTILKEKTRDMLMVAEEHLSVAGAMDTITSSQPLSAAFLGGPNFNRERRDNLRNKTYNQTDHDPEPGQNVVNDSSNDTRDRSEFIAEAGPLRRPGPTFDGEGLYGSERTEQQALRDRWRRRDFYIDEEEGFAAPSNWNDDMSDPVDGTATPAGDSADAQSPAYRRPSHSRSSSRVRFADDLESDARSDVSTSSRPVGERWGGYDIPHAEEDLGQDILYQVSQQGCNEMLDPIFRRKEDLYIEMTLTKAERLHWKNEIDEFIQEMRTEFGVDFSKDRLTWSEEFEQVLEVSLKFAALIAGRSWTAISNTQKTERTEQSKSDPVDGFVAAALNHLKWDVGDVGAAVPDSNSLVPGDGFTRLINGLRAAKPLVTAAVQRVNDFKTSISPTDAARWHAKLEVELVYAELDEMLELCHQREEEYYFETANTSDEEHDSAEESEVDEEHTQRPMVPTPSQERQSRPAAELVRDPTMPQFRPNSAIEANAEDTQPTRDSDFTLPFDVRRANDPTTAEHSSPPRSATDSDDSMPTLESVCPPRSGSPPPQVDRAHSSGSSSPLPPLEDPEGDAEHQELISAVSLFNSMGNDHSSGPSFPQARDSSPSPEIRLTNGNIVADGNSETSASSTNSTSGDHDDDDDDEDEDDGEEEGGDSGDEEEGANLPRGALSLNSLSLPDELLAFFNHAYRDERIRELVTASSEKYQTTNKHINEAFRRRKNHSVKPSPERMARLAILEGVQAEVAERGAGVLTFDEFREILEKEAGVLIFVENWLELGSL
ncbi:hypothetical protein IWX90DRAFT_428300 [Phyllosticta citrichinensis]|uniref:Uncharacterized protein n=1 Tax=Phyllosticta citrichinensis TaxID=1130410 RepID=A0ABR1Y0P1_9PEZI